MSTRKIREVLADAHRRGLDRLDTLWLLSHVLGKTNAWLIAHDEQALEQSQADAFASLLHRRLAGEPFAYLVGRAGFHGLELEVAPAVLIPRPDTEVLVDWAIECLASLGAARAVDLGTGSGAIAIAVKHACPSTRLTATDASADALAIARANALRHGLDIDFRQGDWWQAVSSEVFDLVLSNPPYIAAGDSHLPALRHEPLQALTPGGDGLDALRTICAGARQHLRPGGWMLLEHGYDQAEAVQALMASQGFVEITTRRDLGAQPRCTGGRPG